MKRRFGATCRLRLQGLLCSGFRTDLDKPGAELSITLPHIRVTAEYDVDCRILLGNFKGQGVFMGNFSEYSCDGPPQQYVAYGHQCFEGNTGHIFMV
jgi:hypothetical protein